MSNESIMKVGTRIDDFEDWLTDNLEYEYSPPDDTSGWGGSLDFSTTNGPAPIPFTPERYGFEATIEVGGREEDYRLVAELLGDGSYAITLAANASERVSGIQKILAATATISNAVAYLRAQIAAVLPRAQREAGPMAAANLMSYELNEALDQIVGK